VAQQAYLLVGVTKAGEIARVQTPGAEGISSDFLAQFAHRSLQSNWEIASQPEDLLFVPVALRAMRGKPELSESVVLAVKAIMDLVNKKLLKLNVRS